MAPSFIASTASGTVPWAVTMITGVSSPICRKMYAGMSIRRAEACGGPGGSRSTGVSPHALQGRLPVRCPDDLVAVGLEGRPGHQVDARIVVDNHDPRRRRAAESAGTPDCALRRGSTGSHRPVVCEVVAGSSTAARRPAHGVRSRDARRT